MEFPAPFSSSTTFTLEEFNAYFSMDTPDRVSSETKAEYLRIQRSTPTEEVSVESILALYLPYFKQKEIEDYIRKTSQFVVHASGQQDEEEPDYRELVSRCIALKVLCGDLNKLLLDAYHSWHAAYKEMKKQNSNKEARKNLKPSAPNDQLIFAEILKLNHKVAALNSSLSDQGIQSQYRKDIGGWTTLKTAGEIEGIEPPWHGGISVQPKSELTNQIWPKSRLLLSIVSKMCKERRLTKTDRGKLKDLILDSNPKLLQILHEYETSGDQQRLYSDFIKLAKSPSISQI